MRRPRQQGFTLLSVLVALLVFSLGLLGLGTMYARFTNVMTQDQFMAQVTPWSNAFWGVVQANPAVVTTLNGTYNSGNVGAIAAPLQPWLKDITSNMPEAEVTLKTGPDTWTGAACAQAGCTVTMNIRWKQNVDPNENGHGVQRNQAFTFQFGL